MSKVLVDTSVWIDALNGVKNWQTDMLNTLIETNSDIVLCPTVIQEILQGIKEDKDFNAAKENLSGFEVLDVDSLEAAYGAATLYRNARKRGITIRKSNDCLIAFYCIAANAIILHNDSDFDRIAQYSSLQVLQKK